MIFRGELRRRYVGQDAQPPAPGLSFQLGVHRDQMNGFHTLMKGNSGGARVFALSSVWIQEGDDHPIVREMARALHERLAAYAPTQRIGWGPPGTMPPPGERNFDYYILLELPESQVIRLPGYRTSRGVLRAETGTYPPGGRHAMRGPVSTPLVNCDGDSKLNFSQTHFGLETRLSGDQRVGRALAEDLFNQLEKNFDDLAEKHGPPAKLPDLLYGPMRDGPPKPFPDSVEVATLQSGYGLGEAYQACLEQYARGNTSAAITLAEQHADKGELEAARAMVRRAEVFAWFESKSLAFRERLEPLWETLEMDRLSHGHVDMALLKELDAVFPEESLPVVREAPPGHLILFYWPGEPCLWGFRVVRSSTGNHAWDLECMQVGRAMSSWGSSGFDWPEEPEASIERHEYLSAGGENIDLTIRVNRLPNGLIRIAFSPE